MPYFSFHPSAGPALQRATLTAPWTAARPAYPGDDVMQRPPGMRGSLARDNFFFNCQDQGIRVILYSLFFMRVDFTLADFDIG